MNDILPELEIEKLGPTRDYLREVALVLSGLQRAFMPKHPRQWQYGLEVTMRGVGTQSFKVAGRETRAGIDLVRKRIRLGNDSWRLRECDGPELLKILQTWLETQKVEAKLDRPAFGTGRREFDKDQANAYAAALWWLEARFRTLKAGLDEGVTSPILLYPHHFDLSLVWFPHDDERQLALGFSTGDETVKQPYLYLTAYPEPAGFTALELPAEAHWQKAGFSGAVLPYAALRGSGEPERLFKRFAEETLAAARPLFG